MSTPIIVGVAFLAGLVLATFVFGALWWAFRKTIGIVKMLVGWALTVGVLAACAGALWFLLMAR